METTSIYNVPMLVLYMVCRMGWALCRRYLADFTAYKSLYTQAYIDAQLLAVDNAENTDNNRIRNAEGNNLRLDAEEATRQVCANWQVLKTYIVQAYKGAKLDNMLAMAGADSYGKTSAYNWAETQLLISSANKFITDNADNLLADGYMPNTFAAKFAADGQVCLEKCNTYITNNGDKRNVSIDKVAANNAIYNSLISMFSDGRQIFRGNDAVRNQFSFASFKILAAGNGAGSLRGRVTDPQTGKAVAGVTVSFVSSNQVRTTNKRGSYKMARLAAGNYVVEFSKDGYQPHTIMATIETSTLATFNVQMQPAVAAVELVAAVEQLKVA